MLLHSGLVSMLFFSSLVESKTLIQFLLEAEACYRDPLVPRLSGDGISWNFVQEMSTHAHVPEQQCKSTSLQVLDSKVKSIIITRQMYIKYQN